MQRIGLPGELDSLAKLLRSLAGAVFVVEGCIGSGKTTLLRSLLHHADALFKGRRVTIVTERINDKLLRHFIAHPKQMAFPFQLIVASGRIVALQKAIELARKGDLVFLDRGLPGDMAFAEMHRAHGNISEDEMVVYRDMIYEPLQHFVPPRFRKHHSDGAESSTRAADAPESERRCIERAGHSMRMEHSYDATQQDPTCLGVPEMRIVYLEAPARVCFARMQRRNNAAEVAGYTIDYFHQLTRHYETVIGSFRDTMGASTVRTLDNASELPVSDDGIIELDALHATVRRMMEPAATATE